MMKDLKYKLYFFAAGYFRFFASIQLKIWKPRIVVVTGSSGKTTLLHFFESQIKLGAKYSHHANSSFGIPFDILGLQRVTLQKGEWLYLILAAPFKAFKRPFTQNLYIVEADCDRPGEGEFLAKLLKPEILLWTNVSATHAGNFDKVVGGKFKKVDDAIAYEFGYFLEQAKDLVIVNGDDPLINSQLNRTKAQIVVAKKDQLGGYKVLNNGTEFKIKDQAYSFNCLLPEEVFYSVAMAVELLKHLGLPVNNHPQNFVLPPGRGGVFKGIKNITIIDSSYNATLDGMRAIIQMFSKYPAQKKWAVLGDMIELGMSEVSSHKQLAEWIAAANLDKIILMGPRVSKYTYPKLQALVGANKIEKFELPKQALDYLLQNINGETILFKGARFLEGVIEHLLMDKADINKLCRREKVWQMRRKEWGL